MHVIINSDFAREEQHRQYIARLFGHAGDDGVYHDGVVSGMRFRNHAPGANDALCRLCKDDGVIWEKRASVANLCR